MTKTVETKQKTKKLFLIWAEEGGVGKSDTANKIAYAFESNGYSVAKFDADAGNKTFYNVYSNQKDDNPVSGCQLFNIETNKEAIFDTTTIGADIVVIDLPARALDLIQSIFGDIEEFYKGFAMLGYELNIITPIVEDKSIKTSLTKFIDSTNGIVLDEKINLIALVNTGFMKYNKTLDSVLPSYNAFVEESDIKNKPNFNYIEVELKTPYDAKGLISELVKTRKYKDVFTSNQQGFLKVLLVNIESDIKRLYQAVK